MSPRTSTQLAKIKDQRREQILDAALLVMARRGLEATKVSDLAAAAQMSQGLLYRYFPSKEAVYASLIERATSGARDVAEEALVRRGSPWDRLRWFCETVLDGVRERPHYVAVLSEASGTKTPPEARAAVARDGRATFKALVHLLEAGQVARQVASGDPAEMARAFFGLIQGLAMVRARDQGRPQPLPRAEVVLRLFKRCGS